VRCPPPLDKALALALVPLVALMRLHEAWRGVHPTLVLVRRLAAAFPRKPQDPLAEAAILATTERALYRAARLVPGSTCLHRALAGRVWLARQGLDSSLVIGLRRQGRAFTAHAWLATPQGQVILRDRQQPAIDYPVTWSEAQLVDRGSQSPQWQWR